MALTRSLVLAAIVHPSIALVPCNLHDINSHRLARFSSALSYSNGVNGEERLFSPLPRPKRIIRRVVHRRSRQEPQGLVIDDPIEASPPLEPTFTFSYANGENDNGERLFSPLPRPRRIIKRVVHRREFQEQPSQGLQLEENVSVQAPSSVEQRSFEHDRNRPTNRSSRLSLSRHPQLDEFLDTPEHLPPNEAERKGARRVTFKATRVSSKAMLSRPVATLTEYMTQPVSQYSLLSFHDAEGSTKSNQMRSRRWLVRRLTTDEAQRYLDSSSSEVMDESNLFRLAVPLLPLIGWDLTPVIDLEVIPPQCDNFDDSELSSDDDSSSAYLDSRPDSSVDQAKWAPLRGIRKRIKRSRDDRQKDVDGETPTDCDSPVVKIRSLRVSLLSTQEEVNEVMSSNGRKNTRRGSNMQQEALEMVGKVEEWLRPHISFEAELSWNDGLSNIGVVAENESLSTVSVKSTAITSLTIPKISPAFPSAFLVKRLGATLTSQALAICLPRFLRQLEKDYNRWSGLGLSTVSSSDVVEETVSRNSN